MKYNQEDFLKDLQESFDMCLNIARKKNTDYASKVHDPFRNFRMVEHLGLCSTKTGIIVRLSDKLARICNLLDRKPEVISEALEDTILDAINYLAILRAYLKQEKNRRENE